MTTGKLIIGVTTGILLAVVIVVGVYQAMQPRDCALQRLEESTGERAPYDVDEACQE